MPEIHNPRVIGVMTIQNGPTEGNHPVRLMDLDARISNAPVFVSNVTPTSSGIVANKTYAPTVPANKILLSAVADVAELRVHVLAQGSYFMAPEVTVNGVAVANFTAQSDNMFSGYVDLVLAESGPITVVSNSGAETSVEITLATEGPAIQTATIGALPGTQTEAKQGDVIAVTGTVENSATSIAVLNLGAAQSGNINTIGADDSAGAGFKTFAGTFTVANRTGAQGVSLVATNALGTDGDATVTGNTVTLNQTSPTIGAVSINYPNGQGALTNGDTAQVSSTITNADAVNYSFAAAGQTVSIADPSVYAISKDVTLTSGTYTVGNNYTITATKASNGAVSTRQAAIRIAETPATATVTVQGNPARLRTSETGESYVLRVQANQLLSEEPTVSLSVGSFTNSWSFSGGVYSRTFTITDADPRGDLIASADLVNLGNNPSTASGTFTIGGLVERSIVFPSYARYAPLGVAVADITKTRARYAGTDSDLTLRNDTTDVAQAYTIVNSEGVYDANGTHLFISDAAYAGANTSGTLELIFEETV